MNPKDLMRKYKYGYVFSKNLLENQFVRDLLKENKQLKDNWNKLKKYVNKHYDYYMNNEDYIGGRLCFTDMKNKIQKIEQGNNNK